LTSQIRRAALSVHSNIAEGYGKYTYKENIKFYRDARGSLTEVLYQLYAALDEEYIDIKLFKELYKEGKEVEQAIDGYIGFLKNQERC